MVQSLVFFVPAGLSEFLVFQLFNSIANRLLEIWLPDSLIWFLTGYFFLSSHSMISSLFVELGPTAAGWTIYPPLSAVPEAMGGSGTRYDFMVGFYGYLCIILAWLTELRGCSYKTCVLKVCL
jgi:heme/copper-type cytochrome/quinol oxidase subunit 1